MKKLSIVCLMLSLIFCGFFLISCSPFKVLNKNAKGLNQYNIVAEFNDDEKKVEAKMNVDFKNKTDAILKNICFNLYPRAFREDAQIRPYTSLNEGKCFVNGKSYGDITIENIKVDDKKHEFNYVGEDDNALEIKLNSELYPEDKINIEMDFTLILPECAHRLGYLDGSVNLGNWFPILAVYEKGEYVIEPYYSTGDPFYSETANYYVTFTFPKDYNLSSTGLEIQTSQTESLKQVSLEGLAVRDFAIFLTKEAVKTSRTYENIEINYVGYQEDKDIEYLIDVAQKSISFFSKKFGKYPYKKIDIVKAPFMHGGMEYPSAVIISDSFKEKEDIAKVIVHEIAHQWWYAVVGNNEISEAWLDESLAEYSTILFFEEHQEYGMTYQELINQSFASYIIFADIVSSTNKKLNTSMLLNVNDYVSEYEYSYMIYVRGVLMFDSLRSIVGKTGIEKGLKKYYSVYKFKIAKTDDFIATIKNATKKDVESLLDSWLNGKTIVGTI